MAEGKEGKEGKSQAPQDATGGGKQPVGDAAQISMTSAQLEARLQRERAKIERQYADYDELKSARKKLDELEKAQMSELERLKTELAEKETDRQRARQEAQETLVRAAFVAEAAKAGVAHPEDAYNLANRGDISVKDGQVEGAADAVTDLVDAGRLVLAGKPKAPSLDAGAGGGERGDAEPSLTGEELVVARKLGISPEEYAEQKATPVQKQLSAEEELDRLRAEIRHLRGQGS